MIKRLLIILLLFASSVGAQAFDPRSGRSVSGYTEVSFTTTPEFSAAQNAIFKITLTGNVTSSTLVSPFVGQYLRFVICQDAVGSRTFAWPASFVDGPTIHSTASACQLYIFTVESILTIRFVPTVGTGGSGGAVSSVFGRTGAVVKVANDYAVADISGLQTALDGKQVSGSYEAPLTFNAPLSRTTNAVDCVVASGSVAGCLSAANWTTFNSKQAALGFTPENPANKNAASGYAGLGATSKIATAQISAVLASSDLTNDSALEKTANKNAVSGYAGLSAGSKITASQMSAVLASSDLTNDSALEKTVNKGAANGYAPLNASSRVPIANIASGVPDGTKFVRDDGTLVTPSGGGAVSSVFTRTGAVVAASGDYTAAQVTGAEDTANKGAVNGYAGLGANSRVPTAQLGSGTADATTFLRGDQTYAAPSGGSDPWTYVRLVSDFVTSSATAVDVTGMAFTPAANLRYEISGTFLLRTATTTVGPRTGVAWPTGMTDGVVVLRVESAAGTQVMAQGNINAAVLAPVGGLPTNTQSYPGELRGMLLAGATPSGTFKIQLASETAGTNVTMKAGSFLRWRTF